MSRNDKVEKDDELLAAEYVLGVLSHEERTAFAARIDQEPSLKARVRFWNERLATFAGDVEPVAPPSTVFAGVEGRLFATEAPKTGWWSSLQLWRSLAIASLAALIVAGIYLVNAPIGQKQDGQTFVAQISGETGVVQLVAFIDADEGRLKLNRTQGTPAQGRDFELWLIEGGNNPVSLGVLPEDQVTTLAVPDALIARLSGAILAISDEPLGGSPTGQPTGVVLATGEVVQI